MSLFFIFPPFFFPKGLSLRNNNQSRQYAHSCFEASVYHTREESFITNADGTGLACATEVWSLITIFRLDNSLSSQQSAIFSAVELLLV
jgi:hypothetical protein